MEFESSIVREFGSFGISNNTHNKWGLKMKTLKTVPVLMLLAAANFANAEPKYLPLESAANANIEDDGIADNGKGGWTDEGINDMLIYPPIPSGEVTRNGYKFKIINPAENSGNSVIMLKGADRCKENPQEVSLKVPSIKSKYIYILQNSAGQVKGEPKNYLVAVYTVKYDDGTSAEMKIQDGIEIHQWWTQSWWDNSDSKSWPMFMGHNFYSLKWSQHIGLWAMQWENPNPGKAITEMKFKSEGKSVPVIWAVTFDDANYFTNPDIKADFKRPDGPPEGFFDKRIAQEQERLFKEMKNVGAAKASAGLNSSSPILLL